jgi:hypothetical protein
MVEIGNERMASAIGRFSGYPYAHLSTDGATFMKRSYTFFDMVNVQMSGEVLTFDYLEKSKMKTPEFVGKLHEVLEGALHHHIQLAGATIDGATYQVKGLNSRDPESLQAVYRERWGHFLTFLCRAHALNGVLARKLPKLSPKFRELQDSLRRVSVTVRKPINREYFATLCGEGISTRFAFSLDYTSFKMRTPGEMLALQENARSSRIVLHLPERLIHLFRV